MFALSAGQMEQGPDSVSQALTEVQLSGAAGTEVQVSAADQSLFSTAAPKAFGYAFFSSPDLADSSEVTFTAGQSSAHASATLSSISTGMGGPGGMGNRDEMGGGGPMGEPPAGGVPGRRGPFEDDGLAPTDQSELS